MSLKEYDPSNRRPVKFHALITLLQPLSHISKSVGNEAEFKSLKLIDLLGNTSEVFVYSGNSLRNGKTGRRSGMISFFEAIGVSVPKAEHQVFFSGGYLDGAGVSDLDWENKIRKFFPYLSLIGTAVPNGALGLKGSTMLPGRIAFGDAYLCCFESAEYLYRLFPPALPSDCLEGVESIAKARLAWETERRNAYFEKRQPNLALQQQFQSTLTEWLPLLQGKLKLATQYLEYREKPRHPSTKDGNLAKYLKGAESLKLKGDKGDKEDAKKATGQMISGTWTLHPGAQLYSQWASLGAGITDLEEGALVDALLRFGERPYLGGQSGSGCGLCSLEIWYETPDQHGPWLTIAPGGTQSLSDRAQDCHARYRELLAAYQAYLAEVSSNETLESQELRSLLGGAA